MAQMSVHRCIRPCVQVETLCDLYETLTITQAIIYCNTRRKAPARLPTLALLLFSLGQTRSHHATSLSHCRMQSCSKRGRLPVGRVAEARFHGLVHARGQTAASQPALDSPTKPAEDRMVTNTDIGTAETAPFSSRTVQKRNCQYDPSYWDPKNSSQFSARHSSA